MQKRKTIPRKGSKLMVLDDQQYRWIAYSTSRGTEVRVEAGDVPSSQMLIAQVPKVFDQRWIENIIDFGLEHGWQPGSSEDALTIRKTKTSYRLLSEDELESN